MKILIRNIDNAVAVMTVVDPSTVADCIQKWQLAHPNEYLSHREITQADLPADRTQRDLWRDNGTSIYITDAPVVVPSQVTMRQACLQLHEMDMLTTVETAIPTIGPAAQIEWARASVVERTNPLVTAMQALLSWTEAQTDTFLIEAEKL